MKLKNIERVDFMKKVSCIFLSIVMVFTAMFAFSIDAYAAQTVYLSQSGQISDNDEEIFDFYLEKPRYVSLSFSSSSALDISIENIDLDTDWSKSVVTSYYTTLYCPEGEYEVKLSGENLYDYSYEGNDISYSISIVDSTVAPSKLTPSKKTVKLGIYDSGYLDYTCSPENSLVDKETWSSSNKKVATVSKGGYVVPKSLGTTTVTVKANGGASAKFNVVVNWNYIGIFTGSSRNAPTVNGKNVKWKISNKKIASIKGNKIYAKKAGNTTLKCKKGKITYTVKLHIVSYNTLLKKTKSKLKDSLKDPDSLKIYHVWKGYSSESDPTIVIDYGAKNSYGAMVRDDYCVGYSYYNAKKNKTLYSAYSSESKPKLKSMKKVF